MPSFVHLPMPLFVHLPMPLVVPALPMPWPLPVPMFTYMGSIPIPSRPLLVPMPILFVSMPKSGGAGRAEPRQAGPGFFMEDYRSS